MEDKVGGISPFTLADIDDENNITSALDFLRVKARQDTNGRLIAKEIKRTDPRDVLVQAPAALVSSWDSTGKTGIIEFLLQEDLSFAVDIDTEFEDIDDSSFPDAAAFFAALKAAGDGTLVKVKDKIPVNGVGDVAELEE